MTQTSGFSFFICEMGTLGEMVEWIHILEIVSGLWKEHRGSSPEGTIGQVQKREQTRGQWGADCTLY